MASRPNEMSGIKVDGHAASADPDAIAQASQSIVDVVTAVFEAHGGEQVMLRALDTLAASCEGGDGVTGMTIAGATISGVGTGLGVEA